MIKLPIVVITGRTNVGKSTLFNRISEQVKSITLDYQGVTRDVIKDMVQWQGHSFEIADTGGLDSFSSKDPITDLVYKKALDQLQNADVIVFVCDALQGITTQDRAIAKLLYKIGKPVILLVNKIDNKKSQEHEYEFANLGFDQQISISAEHGTGTSELLQAIVDSLPKTDLPEEHTKPSQDSSRIVLLGKPNVGKSSLMNRLVEQERVIVADQPGTTREAVSERIEFQSEELIVTDTPGVRRQRSIDEPIEELMVKSALSAVRSSSIVLLMVDGTEKRLSDQELKLAFYVFDKEYKPLIILFNKQDLTTQEDRDELEFANEAYEFFLRKIRMITISCKTGKNVHKIMPAIQEILTRNVQQFTHTELTQLFKDALARKPLFHKTNRLSISRVKQVAKSPLTFVLFVNQPEWFGPSQLAFFENTFRASYDLKSIPVRFLVRKA
ncbi:hypothetical protein J120_02145 [candidate division TM6 bacterium JCVI TM6SC1]|uniref:GTPase Der n=1 Tax=candidate division TM6 bacterium JCVI TM6SC1 TaxID=1306947 RepID=A0A0D2JFA0_9BACT|nr:hypothetical protein J120_02145 [candidate division TM6 bacterium JCVI TM6SC1]